MNMELVPPLLRAALDAIPVAATLMDGFDGSLPLVYANPAYARLTGFEPVELEGRRLAELHPGEPGLGALRDAVAAGLEGHATLQTHRKDGRPLSVELHLVPLRNPGGALVQWLALHQESAARATGEGDSRSTTGRLRGIPDDLLTGLHSRSWLYETIERDVGSARRTGRPVALFLADLDAFTAYNEVFGRLGGDACLRQVARTFSHCFRRASDGVARWEGDTLAAVAPDLNLAQARAHAEAMLARVRGLALHHPRSRAGRHVTMSIGVGVLEPGSRRDTTALVAAAHEALLEARGTGGDMAVVRALSGDSDVGR